MKPKDNVQIAGYACIPKRDGDLVQNLQDVALLFDHLDQLCQVDVEAVHSRRLEHYAETGTALIRKVGEVVSISFCTLTLHVVWPTRARCQSIA